MKPLCASALLLGALVVTAALPLTVVQGATTPAGTAVKIEAADDAGATAWEFLTIWVARVLGVVSGYKGISKLGGREGETGKGGTMIGGGLAAQFVPGVILGTGTAAPAATLADLVSPPAVHVFLDGLAGLSLTEPVFLTCLALALVLVSRMRQPDSVEV